MTIRAIIARRDAIRTEMRGIHEAHPDGALPDAQAARWTALTAEADALSAQEQRQAMLDSFDRAAAGGQPVDAAFERERSRVTLGDAIRCQLGATDAGARRAREMSAELQRRSGRTAQGCLWSMGTETRVSTGASASAIVATNLDAASFIQRLYAATRVRQLGATILSGLTANADIPRLAGSTTAYWVADGSAVTASDPTFDKLSLRPKTVGVVSEVSRLTILQATPSIDALIEADMARVLALALDAAAVTGPGTGNQPTGILNTTGIGSVALGTNGGALSYNSVISLMGQIQDQNAEQGALAFLGNYKVKRAADMLVTTYNEPLGESVVFQNMPRAFTTAVPSSLTKGTGTGLSALIYGNWSDLLIGMWSELDILVNPYGPNYAAGNIQIRALSTMDIATRHPASFAAITDIVA